MALRKTHLKKLSLDEIMVQLCSETDPDHIKLIHTFISEKNAGLQEKREAVGAEVGEVRLKLEKSIRNLNVRRRERRGECGTGSRRGRRWSWTRTAVPPPPPSPTS